MTNTEKALTLINTFATGDTKFNVLGFKHSTNLQIRK